VVQGWIERERLRIGGWGIVEGFKFSPEDGIFNPYPREGSFRIDISEGVLIDKQGTEQLVDAYTMLCERPSADWWEEITENLVVNEDGYVQLRYAPYSPARVGIIYYDPLDPSSTRVTSNDKFSVTLTDTGNNLAIYSLVDNILAVDARQAGKTVTVKYLYCNDKIDAVLLDEDKRYHREIGLLSTSPSVNKLDLSDQYLIGLIHWIVGRTITVEFIINDRTYRKVFVNENNILYLNGKPYTIPKFIYFEEPEAPEENDVWYDRDSNALMVWLQKDGIWGWVVMNDFTNVPLRSVKFWYPNDNFPDDAQTFLFDDEELNLRYIPGINSIEVFIDNAVVMNDQFDEVTLPGTKPYLASGIGFKLKDPLDRPTVVECIVHHVVKNAPLRNVFQRAAIFTYENYTPVSADGSNQVFQVRDEYPYAVGANQLEVFVDGIRLIKNADFHEMKDAVNDASDLDKDVSSLYFRILNELHEGQIVSYKISRYVWSYDQLNSMTAEIEQKADDALLFCDDLQEQVTNLKNNTQDNINLITTKLNTLTTDVMNLKANTRKKTDKITEEDLDANILKKLFESVHTYSFAADDLENKLNNSEITVKSTDFITVTYILDDTTRQLTDNEYMIDFGDDARLDLMAELQNPNAMLLVQVIIFGKGEEE
jgi:hypothetical protein